MHKCSVKNTIRHKLLIALIPVMCFCLFQPGTAYSGTDCDLAKIYAAKGREKPKYWQKAIELCPGYIRPYELLGNYYRKKDEADEAIELFSKAAALGSRNHKLYYLLALLLHQKGEIDLAARQIDKSLNLKATYAKSIKLKEEIQKPRDVQGPKIDIIEPATRRAIQVVHQYENLTVRGIATDKSGIAWVKINQHMTAVDKEGNFLKDIPLRVGSNAITIEAADNIDNRSKISVRVKRDKPILVSTNKIKSSSQSSGLYGKSIAVVIGINNYEKWPPLEFAINDAKAIEKKLEVAGFNEIITIFDRKATQRRILTELFHSLPKKVGRNDRVMFYFAGHGQTEDLANGGKRGYIIPVDADTSNYSATAISMEQIRSLSSRISAKHILYVMDSCYSGLGLSRSFGVSSKISGYLKKVASMRVVQIITAGGKGEQVQENEGHGIFTTYFLKALEGDADINKDNAVTGTELGAYLRPVVSNASNQAQTPLYGRLEGEGEFIFSGIKQ